MNLRTKIIRYAVVILFLLWTGFVFYCGYNCSDSKNQLEWAKYKEQVATQNLAVTKHVQHLEQELATAYQKADQGAQNAKDLIDNTYDSMSAKLHNYSTNTTDSKSMSTTATTTSKVCSCRNQYNAKSRQAFRKLRADILTITRDCDITASYYNELINLYNNH
ncbi:MAG: hypothetical protein SOW38_05915 [Succinivibrio sp.]|nr:hypothetical protein [Succinivibrio sp.]